MVVFLGNPGREYERTRHNVGWMVADSLAFASELEWREKFRGLIARARGVYFLKPLTYMNRSGQSVGLCAGYFRINPAKILVVHDDMELAFGNVVLRSGGGLAGHNGLKDLARVLGTKNFERLRFGISRPVRESPSAYVLSRFGPDEEAILPGLLEKAGHLVEERTTA